MAKINPVPDFEAMARNIMKDLPEKASQQGKNFFQGSFIKEGFTDSSFIAWPKRMDDMRHKLLSQSLALRSSIRIDQADMNRVQISAGRNLPYAAIHNEGGTITVTVTDKMRRYFWAMYYRTGQDRYRGMALTKKNKFTIRIPKRQYIGESHTLMQGIERTFVDQIKQAQKKL